MSTPGGGPSLGLSSREEPPASGPGGELQLPGAGVIEGTRIHPPQGVGTGPELPLGGAILMKTPDVIEVRLKVDDVVRTDQRVSFGTLLKLALATALGGVVSGLIILWLRQQPWFWEVLARIIV